MKQVLMTTLLLLAAALALAPSSQAFAVDDSVTVVTNNSDTIRAHRYEVKTQFKVLVLWVGEDERAVSFSDIKAVHNSASEDITGDLLGSYYGSDGRSSWSKEVDAAVPDNRQPSSAENSEWKSEFDRERAERRERLSRSFITASLMFTAPAGDYYDGLSGGIGGEATFHLSLQPNFALSFTVGRSGLSVNESDVRNFLSYFGTVESVDASASAWVFMIGGEYVSPVDLERNRKVLAYVGTSLGAVTTKVEIDALIRDPNTNVVQPGHGEDSQTKLSQRIYGGIAPMLSRSVGLNLNGNLDIVYAGSPDGSGSVYDSDFVFGYLFDLSAGIVLRF